MTDRQFGVTLHNDMAQVPVGQQAIQFFSRYPVPVRLSFGDDAGRDYAEGVLTYRIFSNMPDRQQSVVYVIEWTKPLVVEDGEGTICDGTEVLFEGDVMEGGGSYEMQVGGKWVPFTDVAVILEYLDAPKRADRLSD